MVASSKNWTTIQDDSVILDGDSSSSRIRRRMNGNYEKISGNGRMISGTFDVILLTLSDSGGIRGYLEVF